MGNSKWSPSLPEVLVVAVVPDQRQPVDGSNTVSLDKGYVSVVDGQRCDLSIRILQPGSYLCSLHIWL